MTKCILRLFCCIVLLSCSTSHRSNNIQLPSKDEAPKDNVLPDSITSRMKPSSLLDLPQSQDGEIILSPGFYEAEFRSYCLQPGTPDPTDRDAYTMTPLTGHRKDIIEDVLRHSLFRPDLDQRDIQLLLWSVVSGSDFNKLSYSVKNTAAELLTPKQIFTLQGGVIGVVKTIAVSLPSTAFGSNTNDLKRIFELGTSSYEAYERIAVLREPSVIKNTGYNRNQWYRQKEGYYVRYYPDGYQRVKIQVFVPEALNPVSSDAGKSYLLFDPVNMMAIPANSNAQRLGIGRPVLDVIRKVIEIRKDSRMPERPPVPKKQPETAVPD